MSEGELILFVGSTIWVAYAWGGWYMRLLRIPVPVDGQAARLIMGMAPLVCMAVLFSILVRFSSYDVRSSGFYTVFYLILGAAWLALLMRALPLVGICLRDDGVERGNLAAAWTGAGAWLGLTLAFAGANIGDGPGWWVVIFSASLSSLGWFLAWLVWERLSASAPAVTIDRDVASGIRSAAMAISIGLLTGRCAAGTWVSTSATVADFLRDLWPLFTLLLLGGLAERALGRRGVSEYRPLAIYGWGPALIYLGGALTGLLALGWWT